MVMAAISKRDQEMMIIQARGMLSRPRHMLELEALRGEINYRTLDWFREALGYCHDLGDNQQPVRDKIANATRDYKVIHLNKNTYLKQ